MRVVYIMYARLIKLSKQLNSLDLKKEAQEVLILEGVNPEEIMSLLGLPLMEEGMACEHKEEPEEKKDSEEDFAELMEKLFGEDLTKEKKEDKD